MLVRDGFSPGLLALRANRPFALVCAGMAWASAVSYLVRFALGKKTKRSGVKRVHDLRLSG